MVGLLAAVAPGAAFEAQGELGRGVTDARAGRMDVAVLACPRFAAPVRTAGVTSLPDDDRGVDATDDAPAPSLRDLARGTEGIVFTEYVTLLVLVSLVLVGAFVALGVPLLRYFRYAQMIIAVPFP